MRFKAPLVTLGAGLVVAGVLYTLNVDLSNDVEKNQAAASAKQTGTVAAPASSQPAADPPPSQPASSAPAGDGSGNAGQQGTVTYAGAVDGGAASLAIVVNNGKAIAYVCDGKKVEAWLNGTMANGQVELTGAKGSLKGTYGGGQVKGNVTAGTKSWGFAVKVAAAPSGLYRSAASLRNKLDASWVVLPDGRQVGVQTKNGETSEAPPFDVNSKTVTVDGTKVPIEAGNPNASSGY
ncbi:hypothetical protein AB0J72_00890 [Dactylosporangium sp. NPDC049742]|uniref:hypothetical protein n=1 Tax=Dactylosporangium sp. NPDC049742 TaxID=3154737 RepID=UPI00341319A1